MRACAMPMIIIVNQAAACPRLRKPFVGRWLINVEYFMCDERLAILDTYGFLVSVEKLQVVVPTLCCNDFCV